LDGVGLDKLAVCADKATECAGATIMAAAENTNQDGLQQIKQQISELTQAVAKLLARQSRSGTKEQKRFPKRERSKSIERKKICYYHRKFDEKAWQCLQPCVRISIGQAGKLVKPSPCRAVADGGTTLRRLHVTDKNSGIKFLIDTGADISLLPRKYAGRCTRPATIQLFAVNGTLIPTYGEKLLVLNLDIRRSLKWNFCVAEVTTSIIGADLLYNYNLSVNLRKSCLQDNITGLETKGWIKEVTYLSISTVNQESEYHRLLAEFPNLTQQLQLRNTRKPSTYHHIQMTGPPVAQRFRRLTPEKLKIAVYR